MAKMLAKVLTPMIGRVPPMEAATAMATTTRQHRRNHQPNVLSRPTTPGKGALKLHVASSLVLVRLSRPSSRGVHRSVVEHDMPQPGDIHLCQTSRLSSINGRHVVDIDLLSRLRLLLSFDDGEW